MSRQLKGQRSEPVTKTKRGRHPDVSCLHLLHRAGQCAEVLFALEAEGSELTPRQYAVLLTVADNPDVSQTVLVAETGVDRSTLADIVRRLVDKRLLQRKRTKEDARMYAVRITAKGRSVLSSLRPAAGRVDARLLSVLSGGNRASFIDNLRRIVTALQDRTGGDTDAKPAKAAKPAKKAARRR
jgi:DNA-binding MarR family transcriptional regulator